MMRCCSTLFATLAALLVSAAQPAAGWTPATQAMIAREAARLAPPDLYRQIRRNRTAYLQGVAQPFQETDARRRVKNPDGSGTLDQAIQETIQHAIAAIEHHRPFNEISYRLGIVAHHLANLNNPLHCADGDAAERRYYTDFQGYLERAEPRFRLVFYGFRAHGSKNLNVPGLIQESLARCRQRYPLVGREYRRVTFERGSSAFDDRSTAYGIGALAFNHAVGDIAEVLRYIWLRGGGIDVRPRLPLAGQNLIELQRSRTTP